MQHDAQGLVITVDSHREAAHAYDHAIDGYTRFRADTAARVNALLAANPEFGMAHVLKGYFAMAALNGALVPQAREALASARRHVAHATHREQAHAEALAHWMEGDLEHAISTWEQILESHPRDLLAFRLHHGNSFAIGRPERMLSAAEHILPHWCADVPGYFAILACRAFAHEECGQYLAAEAAGRAALALEPGDLWATHAVTHVMEMQGRRSEGIAFLEGLEPHWDAANNLKHHLWWHRALFHLERREFDTVLDLYDRRFRDLSSPLVTAMPDLYNDVLNATSMLFRLELRGVPAGGRWTELADKAEARIGDCLATFTLPHWMMALTGAGRWDAAQRLLDAVRDAARNTRNGHGQILRDAAAPACEAVLAHRRGDHAAAVAAMRPALGLLQHLGGSHAQRDVLEQLFVDSAMRAGLDDDVRLVLERVAGRHPVPPERRIGYAEAARRVVH
jgi:tetratricopeptide (TPR) repeat protein